MLIVKHEAVNTNFEVAGLTRLGIKPKSTAPQAEALSARSSELFMKPRSFNQFCHIGPSSYGCPYGFLDFQRICSFVWIGDVNGIFFVKQFLLCFDFVDINCMKNYNFFCFVCAENFFIVVIKLFALQSTVGFLSEVRMN